MEQLLSDILRILIKYEPCSECGVIRVKHPQGAINKHDFLE